ncbi:hypothetical protein H6B16_000400 [Caecibacteroides pullorum]|nr:hypothetical protein [Caecibacteroides pullorum]
MARYRSDWLVRFDLSYRKERSSGSPRTSRLMTGSASNDHPRATRPFFWSALTPPVV